MRASQEAIVILKQLDVYLPVQASHSNLPKHGSLFENTCQFSVEQKIRPCFARCNDALLVENGEKEEKETVSADTYVRGGMNFSVLSHLCEETTRVIMESFVYIRLKYDRERHPIPWET